MSGLVTIEFFSRCCPVWCDIQFLFLLCGSSGAEARRVALRSLRPVVSFGAMPFGFDSAVLTAWSCGS